MSNSKKQKDHSELVDEKVEVSTVSESDVAASKEEDPFHTAVESITSSPVTSEKEAEEYVSNQTFAAANEHEMQALISILEGEAPADRKAILKALVQREKLKEGASKKTEVNENELNEDWKHGGYPYKNRMSRKIYEKEKYLLQVELLKLQNWVKETGQKVVILATQPERAAPSVASWSISIPAEHASLLWKNRLSVSSVNGTSSVT